MEVLQDWVSLSPHVVVIHLEDLKDGAGRTEQLWRVLRHMGLDGDEFRERAECLAEVDVGGHHRRSGKPKMPDDVFSQEIRRRCIVYTYPI